MALEREENLPDRPSHESTARSTRALLKEAQTLAIQIETLLERQVHAADEACVFRLRLARAHALGLLDQLEELVGPAYGRTGPGVQDCRPSKPPESGERSRSGVVTRPSGVVSRSRLVGS
jgi:hypothetical protein